MPEPRPFIVVSGAPGSGKSTLAPAVAHRLRLPLLAKDTVKDALLTTLGAGSIEDSRRLGGASIAVLLALAAASPIGAVIESVFVGSLARDDLRRLPGSVVEVFCRCDRDTAARRYRARAGTRHDGHFDSRRTPAELWNDENATPVAGGWAVLEVETTRVVDVDRVVADMRAALGVSGVAPSAT